MSEDNKILTAFIFFGGIVILGLVLTSCNYINQKLGIKDPAALKIEDEVEEVAVDVVEAFIKAETGISVDIKPTPNTQPAVDPYKGGNSSETLK
jgi:hypothetical protein